MWIREAANHCARLASLVLPRCVVLERGPDIRVPAEPLDLAEICRRFEHCRAERAPEAMDVEQEPTRVHPINSRQVTVATVAGSA